MIGMGRTRLLTLKGEIEHPWSRTSQWRETAFRPVRTGGVPANPEQLNNSIRRIFIRKV
jgi:hypothetical protein